MNSSEGSREGAECVLYIICVLYDTEPENETLITCDTWLNSDEGLLVKQHAVF